MIVVTGSTGRVGRLVASALERAGEPMRLVVRDPHRAPKVARSEVAVADYGNQEALARALHEGDRVFMVSLWIGGDVRLELHRSFIDAATNARVGHLTYLSFVNARPNAVFSHAREHGATEAMLRASGLQWSSIRNSMYADDIPGWFDPDGVAREPGNDSRMSFSYRRELADVIVITLTRPGHGGQVYDITTPESVTMEELTQIARDVTGDDYGYAPITDEAWVDRWRAQGRPDWALEAGLSSYQAMRAGEFDVVSDDYRRLTGREPASIAQVIADLEPEMPLTAKRSSGRVT